MATSSRPHFNEPFVFDKHAVVRLRSVVGADAGVILPGTLGTVVYRHDGGGAYEVEFAEPVHQVVTLRASDLSLAA